jgi:hypothetical protein
MSDPVTIRMARADAEMLRAVMGANNLFFWGDDGLADAITPELVAALDAALAAPGEPESDTLEKAAMEVVEAWGHIRCDSRNDAPWRQLRDWEGFDAVMAALMALVEDKMRAEAFAEDEGWRRRKEVRDDVATNGGATGARD